MRRVLALDTSTWWGGAALVEQDGGGQCRTVVEIGVHVPDSHAARLLSWVDRLLAEAGWSRSDLDGYAASIGPGSFTGIRVSLGFLRGIALATSRPCQGVTTLEAVAHAHGPAEAERLVVMEAGRGQLYTARFDPAGDPPGELLAPGVSMREPPDPDVFASPAVVIPGPGTVLFGEWTGLRPVVAPASIAAAVGRLAMPRLAAGGADRHLAPLYLRPPDAVLNRRPGIE